MKFNKYGSFFILIFFMIFFPMTSSGSTNNEINLTIPSQISITLNEDMTNTISPFTIQNNTSVPITITSIEASEAENWILKPQHSRFNLDEKAISLVLENTYICTGVNTTAISIPNNSSKSLDIYIERGIFSKNISETSVCQLVFNYEIGQSNFTVTLDCPGANEGDVFRYEAKNGESLILPAVTKDGYSFSGWYHSTTNETYLAKDNYIVPIKDSILTALWQPIEYSISYQLNGGAFQAAPKTSFTIESDDFTLPIPTKEGFSFSGWTTSNNEVPVKEFIITKGTFGDKTFSANWELPSITLIYNDGKNAISTIQTNKATDLPIPTKTGYTFKGWYIGQTDNGKVQVNQFSNPNTTYPWTVDNDGVWSSGNSQKHNTTSNMISDSFIIPENGTITFDWQSNGQTNNDYLGFDIYNLDTQRYLSGNTAPTYRYCLSSLKTASDTYSTFTSELEAGTYQILFMYGKNASIHSNEDKGYVQNVIVDGGIIPTDLIRPDTFNEDMVLIAKWEANQYTYDIIHQSSSGKILETSTITNTFNTSHKIASNTYEGYKKPVSKTVKWDSESKTITFTYTPMTYTISYDLSAGEIPSNAMLDYTIETGTVTLPTPTYSVANSPYTYEFSGWYETEDYLGQSITKFSSTDLESKTFYGYWTTLPTYILLNGYAFNTQALPDSVTQVVFTDIPAPTSFITEDVSQYGDGSVVAWLDNTTYYVSTQKSGQKIIAYKCNSMFRDKSSLTNIDFSNLDTSKVTDFSYMFYGLDVTNLDLRQLNTSSATDMQYMFRECENLTSINLSSFDTGKVLDMQYMFYGCKSLPSIDLRNFNTSNVTNMQYMFFNCEKLMSVDLSNFDTSKVTNMHSMFYLCYSLPSLNLSNFDTRKVTVSEGMFWMTHALSSVTLGEKWYWNDIKGPLPTQNNQWLTGADGYWYAVDGTAYTPDELISAFNANPSGMAGTYYALKP